MADWKDIGIADLERQIAELRAERDALSVHLDMTHSEKIAAEAENARLRALPLKDEVERVLEPFARIADKHHSGYPDNEYSMPIVRVGELRAAQSLLSRLLAGEQEGWRLPEGTLAVHGKDVIIAYDDFKDARRAFSILENVIGAAPSEQGGGRG